MNRKSQCIAGTAASLLTLAALGGCLLAGCGGNKGGSSSANLGASRSTGQLTLAIQWPTRTVSQTRVIPTATTAIQLQVISQSGIFTSTGTNTYTTSIPYGTATYTVSGVPAGSVTIVAGAVLQQSGGTLVLANVSPTTVNIVAQQATPLNLTLSATLTTATTAVTATIQKVLNPDGSAVSPTDPAGQPQPLTATTFNSPYTGLQDQAVYKVVASLASSATNGLIPLPATSEFSFDIENDYDLTGATAPFLTPVDSVGNPLAIRPAVGNAAYFKVNLAGSNGELYVPLNAAQFSDPNSGMAPFGVYYFAAPGFTP